MKNSLSPPEEPTQDYALYAVVFLVAISVRIFFLIWIDEPILFFKYPFFAEKLANGEAIGERLVDLSPFYLYFLTLLNKLFSLSWPAIKCFQIFIGAINVLIVFAIGNRLFQKGAAFIAALMFAVYGNLIVLETTFEPTVFVLLFNLLTVYFLVLSRDDSGVPLKNYAMVLASGIATGLVVITKPNFLLFLPVGVVWLLFFRKTDFSFKKSVLHALLFLSAVLLVMAPITVRNYVKMNDFILVTADSGKVFFHGNSKTATAIVGADLSADNPYENSSSEPDYAHVLFRKTAEKVTGKALLPSQSAKFWIKITLKDILDDPRLYLKRELKKCIHFFTDYEVHYIASAHKEYKKSLYYPFMRYGMIISFGFLGIVLSRKKWKDLFLIYGTISVYLASCAIFLVQSRYRTPAVPYFCLFSGYAIYSLKGLVEKHKFKFVGSSFLIFGVFYFSSHFVFNDDLHTHDQWQEATKICYEMDGREAFRTGRYQEAIEVLNRCTSIISTFCPAYILRGKSYAMLGEHKRAEIDFKKAISLRPDSPHGYRNIGFLYLLQGKENAAGAYLREALIHAPHDRKVKKALKDLSQR